MLVPNTDFDPTEAGIPWHVLNEAGHDIWFASQDGTKARCDQVTLTGKGLKGRLKTLAARPANRKIYLKMEADARFESPLAWKDVDPDEFEVLILPGGHAPGMKPYLESEAVFDICRNFFARKAPVASVCHGVLALARTKGDDGRSILYGYKVTGLTNIQEKLALRMTRKTHGLHYQTYPETVQDEVRRSLKGRRDFKTGSILSGFGTARSPRKGFIVEHGHLLSARWPGDVYKLAHALKDRLDKDTA
jgi:protease I